MFVPNTTSRPPADMAIPHTEQLIFTIATQIPFIVFFYIGIRNIVVRGDPKALLCGIGGCLASAFEPVVDILGFCYFPREGNWVAFETFGRPIPIFVPATYGWFVGGMGYWFWNTFQDPKTTASDIPKLWFKGFLINLILEYPPLYYGIYTYYGYQPLVVGGFPLWFPAVNATSPMVAATILNLITPHLKGWSNAVVISTTATSYGMANAAFGAPVWMALSVDKGYHVTYPAVCISALLLSAGLWIMSLQFTPNGSIKLNGKTNGQTRRKVSF
ncbi:hypothetical protein F5X68DRAFT_226795 [Plectosphaerella plurivora]|uniref:Uncharacterized protein n=1 Tax=Plectosphaerella plurivora TaxID=936078 RepID=A0A9P8VMQ7_9PEZI|nr:hypothetical protein F5X68DRAFT_226795 [Plectosphaerella plurivora]